MTWSHGLILFAAGVLAGGLNALAGGGGFVTLPAFIFAGSTPIRANIGGTIAVWPGLVASFYAYRRHLKSHKHPLKIYALLGLIGAVIGALLLLWTTNAFFMAMLPYLLLFATLLFVFGRDLTFKLVAKRGAHSVPAPLVYLLLFLIAVYGGYFGGGMGIMTLAVLTLIGMEDIHEMNALKSLLVVIINGVGVIVFTIGGKVDWSRCAYMTGGCILGGYGAGRLVQRVSQKWVRRGITAIASGMTLYFFLK